MAGALEGNAEGALVPGTGAGLPSRLDLSPLAQISPQAINILIVDLLHLVHTKGAHFPARHVAVTIAATGARATTRAASASATSTVTPWAGAAEATTLIATWPLLLRLRLRLCLRLAAASIFVICHVSLTVLFLAHKSSAHPRQGCTYLSLLVSYS